MPEKPTFTEEQTGAMFYSRVAIQALDDATEGYVPTYDPARDPHPNLVSHENSMALGGWASRTLILDLPDGQQRVYLQRYYGEPRPDRIDKTWRKTLRGPEFAAYRGLLVNYVGMATFSKKGSKEEESHTIYSVNQPDGLLHGQGIILTATKVFKRELIPIENSPMGNLTGLVREATKRLGHIATNTSDPAEAESLNRQAQEAAEQKFIVSMSLEPVNGWRLLDAKSAERLAGAIRFAVAYGKDWEPDETEKSEESEEPDL